MGKRAHGQEQAVAELMIEHNPNPNVPKPWHWSSPIGNGMEVSGFAETKRAARLAMFAALGVRKRTGDEQVRYLRLLGIGPSLLDEWRAHAAAHAPLEQPKP